MRVKTKTLTRARQLRQSMSLPEVVMWRELRRERFKGWKFRRQMPVGPYIADFGCVAHKVIIEIDGAHHDSEEAVLKDARRTAYLRMQGFEIVRIAAIDVLRDLNAVLEGLAATLERES